MKCECGGTYQPVTKPITISDGCAFDGPGEECIGYKCDECGAEIGEED